jgi:hypothetical protein
VRVDYCEETVLISTHCKETGQNCTYRNSWFLNGLESKVFELCLSSPREPLRNRLLCYTQSVKKSMVSLHHITKIHTVKATFVIGPAASDHGFNTSSTALDCSQVAQPFARAARSHLLLHYTH